MTINATALIAQGSTAVNKAISDIENTLKSAKQVAETDIAAITNALNTHIQTHVAEVTAAQGLTQQAQAVLGVVAPTPAAAVAPVATLTAQTSLKTTLHNFMAQVGWKGLAVIAAGLLVLDYLHHIGKL